MSESEKTELEAKSSPTERHREPRGPAYELWSRWQRGERPDVQEFLARHGDFDPAQVLATLRVDQRERWQLGERVAAERYLQAFPQLENAGESAVELIYHEFLIREELDEYPAWEEYSNRFPRHAERLKLQIDLHRALLSDQPFSEASPAEDREETAAGCLRDRGDRGAARDHQPDATLPAIPGYEILGVLGRGGMGVVYRARELALNRLVALKMVLGGEHASPERLERFRAEAQMVARLHHPNVVQIYEIGEHDGLPYLALELVDGGSLCEKLNGNYLPPFDAAKLVHTLAITTQFAHERGVVHRDLKPANVLLRGPELSDERSRLGHGDRASLIPHLSSLIPKITDFGLAKTLESGDMTRTGSGAILGSPSYMAPEQASGKSNKIGPAADVYSLGAILYELLTGRPPFRAETPLETLNQVLSQEPVSISRLQPKTPRDVATICLKCLEKEPSKRYSSALALADDLERFLSDQPILARRAGPVERTWRWCRRNPLLAAMSGSAASLLILVAAISTFSAVRLRHDLARVAAAEHNERTAMTDAIEKLFRSNVEQAKARRSSRQPGQRFEGLRAIRDAMALAPEITLSPERNYELRNAAIACLALPDLRIVKQWDEWPEDTYQFDFDQPAERYVRTNRAGDVTLRRIADDAEIARWRDLGPDPRAAFSPDGQYVAISSRRQLRVWTCGGDEPAEVLKFEGVDWWNFSPDSRQLAIGFADGPKVLVDVASGERLRQLGPGPAHSWFLFNPSGSRVAVCGVTDTIQIIDVESGELVRELAAPAASSIGTNFAASWHPDGQTLAAGAYPEGVVLWDVTTGAKARVLPHLGGAMRLAFNATGELLLSYAAWDAGLRLWHTQTGKPWFGVGWDMYMGVYQAPPDGRILMMGRSSGLVRLYEVVPGREYRTLVHSGTGKNPYESAALKSDGRLLAAGTGEGFELWDVVCGRQLADVPIGREFGALRDYGVLFESSSSGALVTNGAPHLLRWPVRQIDGEIGAASHTPSSARFQVGPPEQLSAASRGGHFGASRDGKVVAFPHSSHNGAVAVFSDRPDQSIRLGPHDDVRFTAVSPDGELVATGSWGNGARVWSAKTGELIADLATGDQCLVEFSPNGRWLATSSGGGQLWRVGTWEQGPSLRGVGTVASGLFLAFSPDSSIVALSELTGSIRLIDTETGRDVAELTDPHQHRVHAMSFSADGSNLVTVTVDDGGAIHLWDLRLLRAELAKMGLDWHRPQYPSAAAHDDYQLVVVLDADRLVRQAMGHSAAGRRTDALAILRRAVETYPTHAIAHNNLAWLLVTGPAELRDPAAALVLARRAFELAPDRSSLFSCCNTLGVVYYRIGEFQQAIETLEPNTQDAGNEGMAFDWIVLAMSHQRLGELDQARACFDQAIAVTSQSKLTTTDLEDFVSFRAEAEALLGK